MKLPFLEQALVPDSKLVNYRLNPLRCTRRGGAKPGSCCNSASRATGRTCCGRHCWTWRYVPRCKRPHAHTASSTRARDRCGHRTARSSLFAPFGYARGVAAAALCNRISRARGRTNEQDTAEGTRAGRPALGPAPPMGWSLATSEPSCSFTGAATRTRWSSWLPTVKP